jgi:hypothetical protein
VFGVGERDLAALVAVSAGGVGPQLLSGHSWSKLDSQEGALPTQLNVPWFRLVLEGYLALFSLRQLQFANGIGLLGFAVVHSARGLEGVVPEDGHVFVEISDLAAYHDGMVV